MDIFMNQESYPATIQDFEVLPIKLEVRGNSCIGTRKYRRDIMISLTHRHGTNREDMSGYVDIMLTTEQAKDLARFLTNMIEENAE